MNLTKEQEQEVVKLVAHKAPDELARELVALRASNAEQQAQAQREQEQAAPEEPAPEPVADPAPENEPSFTSRSSKRKKHGEDEGSST